MLSNGVKLTERRDVHQTMQRAHIWAGGEIVKSSITTSFYTAKMDPYLKPIPQSNISVSLVVALV